MYIQAASDYPMWLAKLLGERRCAMQSQLEQRAPLRWRKRHRTIFDLARSRKLKQNSFKF